MATALAAPASKACRKAAAASPPETLCSSAEHARLAFVKRNWSLPAGWLPLTAAAAAAAAAASSSSSSSSFFLFFFFFFIFRSGCCRCRF